jgi:hypothetical protein
MWQIGLKIVKLPAIRYAIMCPRKFPAIYGIQHSNCAHILCPLPKT